jgi:hypothetical protein
VGAIANINDAPAGSVTITGNPTEDQVLTAANSLSDEDGLGAISYQWQRNGADIAGATASTYTLAETDVGSTITVDASYTDQQRTAESISSGSVTPIAKEAVNTVLAQLLTDTAEAETTASAAEFFPIPTTGPEDTDGDAEEPGAEQTETAEAEEQAIEAEQESSDTLRGEQKLLTQTAGTLHVPIFTYTPQTPGNLSISIDVTLEPLEVPRFLTSDDPRNFDTTVMTTVSTEDATFERLRQMFNSSSDVDFWLGSQGFVDGIDHLQDEVLEEAELQKLVVGSGFAVTSGLSVGYVLWIARSGVLLSTVLSSMPAWRFVDPFPVLASVSRDKEDKNEEDAESLQSIASNSTGDDDTVDDDTVKDAESDTEPDGKADV